MIASYLVNSVWELVLVAGAGWLASRLLRKLGPQVEHIMWVSALVLAVLMPALPFLRPLFLNSSHALGGQPTFIYGVIQGGENLATGSIHVLPSVLVLPLMLLYAGTLFFFAVRLGWSFYRTGALLRDAAPAPLTPEQDEIWRRCQRAFSLGRARVLSSQRIAGPVTLGLRKSVLLVPAEFSANCEPQDFLAALLHECAHIKRRDFQKNILYELATLALAFHPAIWIIKSRIAQTREMICDSMATNNLIDSHSYIQSLLRLATMIAVSSQAFTAHAIGIFDANILEERIMMMNVKRPRPSFALKYGLVIPAALLLLSVAAGGAAMAVVIEPQAQSQAASQEKPYGRVYHAGKDVSAPIAVNTPEAKFPKSASGESANLEGVCLIGLVVDESGAPRDVHVTRSLRPDFDANAIKAVQQYRFTPAMRKGKPVAVAVSIEINFKKF
jgi:TonB family protein